MSECVKKARASSATADAVVSFEDLTPDMLQGMLFYLPVIDCCSAARSCRKFYAAYKLPGLWALDKSMSYIWNGAAQVRMRMKVPAAIARIGNTYLCENRLDASDGLIISERARLVPEDLVAAWCGISWAERRVPRSVSRTYGCLVFVRKYPGQGCNHEDCINVYFDVDV